MSLFALSAEYPQFRSASQFPLPTVGDDILVPLVTGERVRYANLDTAASTSCLQSVRGIVDAVLPWYSSVHRGAGFRSSVSTALYAAAREQIKQCLGARVDDELIFTRNTTDGLNLLARSLPADTTVVTFASEHHANLLPWRTRDVVQLSVPTSPQAAVDAVDAALGGIQGTKLVAVAGASNVTGEVFPLAELAAVVRRHGARIVVDAAQLAPHRQIDIQSLDVDYVVLSGHKLYAPFGAGCVVGRSDWFDDAAPYLRGGGSVRSVTTNDVAWATGAARHEGGTPNVVGAVALAGALQTLHDTGFDVLHEHETTLLHRLESGLSTIDGLQRHALWGPSAERIGVVTFTLDGWDPGLLAAVLSAEYGIGVRDGSFCAQPLVRHFVGESAPLAAVRLSVGATTSVDDVDRVVAAINAIVQSGAAWSYVLQDGRYVPEDDPRAWPELPGLLDLRAHANAGASACSLRSRRAHP